MRRTGRIGFLLALIVMGHGVDSLVAQEPIITPPTLTQFVQATLPDDVQLPLNAEVRVVLWLTIDEQGVVTEVSLKTGAGAPFDTAAAAAARKFVFTPARSGDTAIAVKVPFAYRFRGPSLRGRILPVRQGRRALHPAPGSSYAAVVLEKGTRTPLAGIGVELIDRRTQRRYEAVTNEDGRFVARGLPSGRLQLRIDTGEHDVIEETVKGQVLRPDDPVPAGDTLYLDPVGIGRYRTDVRDKRKPQAASEVVLTDDELRQVPGTFGDPTRVVASLPGVARSAFGLGYYAVRGANYDNTGFFIDGHPALFLYHLFGGPGVVHPGLIGSLSFYPGGYPVRYGRFAGGIIALDTADPPDDRWHLDFEVDLLKASVLYSIPFDEKKGMLTLALRRSYYEVFLPLLTDDVMLSYTDYQMRVKYRPRRDLLLKLLSLGAEDSLEVSISEGETDTARSTSLDTGFHRLLLGADWDVNRRLRWMNSVVWEHDRVSTARIADGEDDIRYSPIGWFTQWRSTIQWSPQPGLKWESGTDILYAKVGGRYQIPTPPALGDPPAPTFSPITIASELEEYVLSNALYTQVDWEPVKGWRLIPGVRGTVDSYGNEWHASADPKFSTRYQFAPQWTAKGMVGLAHQLPNEFQFGEPWGDPKVPPTRALQGSLGLEWAHRLGWEVSLEGFYNHLTRLPYLAGDLDSGAEGLDRLFWRWDETGRSYGLELLIRKRLGGRHHGWLSYTLSRSERKRPGRPWELFRVDQTHILNAAWTVRLGADWSFGARFTLTTGNPVYPIVGARYDADRDRYQPVFSTQKTRLPMYHRLDVRLDKQWRFESWILGCYLDIQNVYNATNTEGYNYTYDYSKRVPGASIPIIPTVGLRGTF